MVPLQRGWSASFWDGPLQGCTGPHGMARRLCWGVCLQVTLQGSVLQRPPTQDHTAQDSHLGSAPVQLAPPPGTWLHPHAAALRDWSSIVISENSQWEGQLRKQRRRWVGAGRPVTHSSSAWPGSPSTPARQLLLTPQTWADASPAPGSQSPQFPAELGEEAPGTGLQNVLQTDRTVQSHPQQRWWKT